MYRIDLLPGEEPARLAASGRDLLPTKGSEGAAAPYLHRHTGTRKQTRSKTPKPSKGTFLDETIVLRDAAGASLIAAVMEQFAVQRTARRKRQAREIEDERQLLSRMLANGLRCLWFRSTPLVSYERKADAKIYAKPNRPRWFSAQALGRAAALLRECQFADLQVGERRISSGYSLTGKLLSLAENCGVSERSLARNLQRDDLVQLRGPKPKPTFDVLARKLVHHKADRIYFKPTDETDRWRDGLAAFNEFAAAHEITVDAPDEVIWRWVWQLNTDELHTGAKFRRPELFRTSIYRVFNDGTEDQPAFNKGGRLVGAWWINAPEEVRAHIRIDGERTVELDYSACHPRMLYHELGLDASSDPYEIPEVVALEVQHGCEPGAYRDYVKWLMQVLINGGSRPDRVSPPKDLREPPNVARRDILDAIRRGHEPISTAFGSRAGLRLMKIEADIVHAIISRARQEGWPALPVHDAVICQRSRMDELNSLMIEEYKLRLGREPTITISSSEHPTHSLTM